jgi:putative transcriptional regulator
MELKEKMAGEITLSPNPGETIKKWREIFHVSQSLLAKRLGISPSVISDYENGRRQSPGVGTIKKVVEAILEIDRERGAVVANQYASLSVGSPAILDLAEYPVPVRGDELLAAIDGRVVACEEEIGKFVHGYTVIDSIKAIIELHGFDYMKIYGWSSERALVFSGIKYGRSPMVAIRVYPMRPALIVYHKPERIDDLAIKLAESEKISLAVTDQQLDVLIKNLRDLVGKG